MAEVTVISHHNGSMPNKMTGATPAELAQEMGLSLDGVVITVGEVEAVASKSLADGDFVAFQKAKVASGS